MCISCCKTEYKHKDCIMHINLYFKCNNIKKSRKMCKYYLCNFCCDINKCRKHTILSQHK